MLKLTTVLKEERKSCCMDPLILVLYSASASLTECAKRSSTEVVALSLSVWGIEFIPWQKMLSVQRIQINQIINELVPVPQLDLELSVCGILK